jgi:hypothetical protein
MNDPATQKIADAILVLLRPFARILLKCGIGFREFSELAKIAFVDTASKEYGIRGRPTNISRVAVMTGLTRKEVRRIRDIISAGEPPKHIKVTPLAHVLRRWHSEPRYTDKVGLPLSLPFESERGPSFSQLVKDFGGDIPPGAMRTEFKRVGAVSEDESGKLHPIRRIARPDGLDDRVVTYFLHAAYPLFCNIAHNLDCEPGGSTWPQLTTYSRRINKRDTVRLLRVCRDRLEESASSFDDLFLAYEALDEKGTDSIDADAASVAVGLFYFEESEARNKYIWEV